MDPRGTLDLAIVGAGPAGLACGLEAARHGLSCRIFDQGSVADTIRRFPTDMRFFSTSDLLELGDIPFPSAESHPTRVEALRYYRLLAERRGLGLSLRDKVESVRKEGPEFALRARRTGETRARQVILAIGYYDCPKRLGVPGEDLPHVRHYYDEPYAHAGARVVVAGGSNSAVEASLDLFRNGAQVTMVHRGEGLNPAVKYWIRPDFENRVKSGAIAARFRHRLADITARDCGLEDTVTGALTRIPAEAIYLLTGYEPDAAFLRACGVGLDPETLVPAHDPATLETDIPGLFIAGSAIRGRDTGTIFIENGRAHAAPIVAKALANLRGPA